MLAVRRAGAPFDGPFALRSPLFEVLLEERAVLREELADARGALLDALHRAVPAARDRAERRRLLAMKRAVFNDRPFAPGDAELPEPDGVLARALERYASLREREASHLPHRTEDVLAEQRRATAALVGEPRFRAACRYSSPALWEALERGSDDGAEPAEHTSRERGVYAYAARFATKANPFHLFAEIGFAPSAGLRPDGAHEVVLDAPAILEMERRVLPEIRDPHRLWLAPWPFTREEDVFRFWLTSVRGLRVASVPAAEPLQVLADFFAARRDLTGRPSGTRAACLEFLTGKLGGGGAEDASGLVDALVANGLLQEYLLTDPGTLSPALLGAGAESDARLRGLQRLHLARMDAAALGRAEEEISSIPESDRPAYYVNRFGPPPASTEVAAARALRGDLRALRSFFCASHNFSANDAVVQGFVRERLGEDGSAPLLDLLSPFMRDLDALLARLHPEAVRSPDERARELAWRTALVRESGALDHARLRELRPRPLPPKRPLCFNGPLDHSDGTFYVSNVWAGEGRFVARYLLHRGSSAAPPHDAGADAPLDVELAVPPRSTLTWVVKRHAVGCGFDPRLAHGFDRWIGPEEIVVETCAGEVRYRHAPSGRRLRIHYRGFLLAEYLPAECQILLAGHADTFANPFLAPLNAPPGDEVLRVAPLRVGAVCVRRESWAVRAEVATALLQGGPLCRAALLRDAVHEKCSPEDHWYYRTSGAGARGFKPRFLDLCNPLSVTAFRRAVAALPGDAAVSLSPMRPGAAGLDRRGGDPYVTELMVEV